MTTRRSDAQSVERASEFPIWDPTSAIFKAEKYLAEYLELHVPRSVDVKPAARFVRNGKGTDGP